MAPLMITGFLVLCSSRTCLDSPCSSHSLFGSRSPVVCASRSLAPPALLKALSSRFREDDLVAIKFDKSCQPRLCAVKSDGSASPLCVRGDDAETDLFSDPREFSALQFWENDICDDMVVGEFGVGYYGQRPVPSLGGGPGYGAEADEIWSLTEEQLATIRDNDVDVPVVDMGIAHGEKARGGSF